MRHYGFLTENYDLSVFIWEENDSCNNLDYAYIICHNILINNINHDTSMFVPPYFKLALKTKQNTQKQAKRKKECLIVDDDCLIIILYNILYTNLSLVLRYGIPRMYMRL
jgi:hypothetical protein